MYCAVRCGKIRPWKEMGMRHRLVVMMCLLLPLLLAATSRATGWVDGY